MIKIIQIFILLVMLTPSLVQARYVGICNLPYPEGHHRITDKAKRIFNDINVTPARDHYDLTIYIEWYPRKGDSDEGYFYYTNYTKPGNDNNVKVVVNVNDLKSVVRNVIYSSKFDADMDLLNTDKVLNNATAIVNENALISSHQVSLNGIESFYVYTKDGKLRRVKKEKERCTPSFKDSCDDLKDTPEKYRICKAKAQKWTLENFAKAIIIGIGDALNCKLSNL